MEQSNVWLGQGLVCDIKLQLSSEWTSDAISEAGEAAGNLGEVEVKAEKGARVRGKSRVDVGVG